MSEAGRQRRIANLKPWRKGQSGNPGGSSKKQRFRARMNEILDRETKEGQTIEESMCEAQAVEALNGSVQHFVAIRDTVDGKPRQSLELTGADGGAISIIHAELDQRISELLERGEDRASASGRESGAPAPARETGAAESASKSS